MWKDKEEIKGLVQEWKPGIPKNINISESALRYFTCHFIDWLYEKKKYQVVDIYQQSHNVDSYYRD